MQLPEIIKIIISIAINFDISDFDKKINHLEFQNYLKTVLKKHNVNLILEYPIKYRRRIKYKKLYRGRIDCYIEKNLEVGDIAIEFDNFSTISGNSIRKFYTSNAYYCIGILNNYPSSRGNFSFEKITNELISKIKLNKSLLNTKEKKIISVVDVRYKKVRIFKI